MSHQTEMVGELEIIWMSQSLNRQIHVTAKYGEHCQARTTLTVRYTKLGDDVEHIHCLIRPETAAIFITPRMISRSLPVRSTLNAWVSRTS